MAPRFDLERVRSAAREGNIQMARSSALDHLTPYIGQLIDCYSFAAEVAQLLQPSDFYETRQLERDLCDVFGVELPGDLLERYGFDESCATWYVKLTVREGNSGDLLFFVSLHALKEVMPGWSPGTDRGRRGGRLVPGW